ncbi:PadR family transcriptional regulator [Edaphobacter acidisoli]|uniref:PadR family transcriptional regulator n=1 Tax=Edaphobacter acidisoli TaxID=2040573 RepID=A0A916RUM0_9BACT|nr:PadR family transcriptional regulator [Edaphobacter acidisoli]GGA70502.1 PadR family transcriptional regulator [Edaphobacter acidisoli]
MTPTSQPAPSQPQGELFDSLRLELRRGCLVLAVLTQLRDEHYGYTLRKSLVETGLEIEESTLYPLLRRLESQGLLTSQWREEDKRNKRFYRLNAQGEVVLEHLLSEWRGINRAIEQILTRDPNQTTSADRKGE